MNAVDAELAQVADEFRRRVVRTLLVAVGEAGPGRRRLCVVQVSDTVSGGREHVLEKRRLGVFEYIEQRTSVGRNETQTCGQRHR